MSDLASVPGSTESRPTGLQISRHPLVATKLSIIRAKTTQPDEFRRNMQEIAMLLFAEASLRWEVSKITVETPLQSSDGAVLSRPIVIVPILRAGLGMLDGILQIAPEAGVGHIGLYRDERTLRPIKYYSRVPVNIGQAETLLLDPMLATGHSACEAVSVLKAEGAERIQFLCIVACPQGIEQLQSAHPDVRVVAAAVDQKLDARGYIVPGLGDAGDRYFGTG